MVKFHAISDLHLHSNGGIINAKLHGNGETYLIIAGDVCEYTKSFGWLKTLQTASDTYKKILFVPGNHEMWGDRVDRYGTKLQIAVDQSGLNIHVLRHDNPLIDGGCIFVGDTLWTNFNNGDSRAMLMWNTDATKDRRKIRIGGSYRKLDAADVLQIHQVQLEGIRQTVDANADKKIVVVTHQAPTMLSCVTKYNEHSNTMEYLYASNLSEFILDRPNIAYWVHGHTHNRIVYEMGETTVICNPVGYSDEPGLGRIHQLITYEVQP